MARKVIFHDEKSVKNRKRVKKHRDNEHLKKMHNRKVKEHVERMLSLHHNVENVFSHDNNYDEPSEFKDKLRTWVLNHKITRTAVNDLLLILISAGFCFLPKDARTLMSTPTHVPIEILTNGKLWYNGIKTSLENVLMKIKRNIEITLDFSVDGMPISNSSSQQFWPILSAIRGIKIVYTLNS